VVSTLVRRPPAKNEREILWNPEENELDAEKLAGFDAVIHLCGENIASGRWTKRRKKRIQDSRIQSTKLLVQGLGSCPQPPTCLISASAVGYYGDRGDEWLSETSGKGQGFLADLAQNWENSALCMDSSSMRVVCARFGVILSPGGGALAKMTLPFKLGLGGRLGDGNQFMSWISLRDCLNALSHILDDDSIRGAVNIISRKPEKNLEFSKKLAHSLGRPALIPAPAFILRLVLGEMADELLLASVRARPEKLLDSGFEFQDPDLEPVFMEFFSP